MTSGRLTLLGGDGTDFITLLGGAGIADGGAGNDYISGSAFGDVLRGGAGDDEIVSNGGADEIFGGSERDKIVLTFAGLGSTVDGEAGSDFLVVSATTGGDVVELGVQDDGTGLEIDPASGASILVANVETVVFFAGTGADVLTVGELRGSGVATLELGLGTVETRTGTVTVTEIVPNGSGTGTVTVTREIPRVTTVDDNVADSVLVRGSGLDDEYTLNTEEPDVVTGFYRKVRVSRRVSGDSSYSYELILAGSRLVEGDVVRFEAGDGNDRLDAAALGAVQTVRVGTPSVDVTIRGRALIAVEFVTGAGNDTLMGSPFADLLDGGTGSDRYTGGEGRDRFFDDSPATDVDVLIEQFDRDMGLFDNTFVVGTVLADSGGPFGLRPPVTQAFLEAEFKVDDPDLRFDSSGDRWTGTSVVEDLRFIFEEAELRGGGRRNVMVVGDADGFINVGGALRQVAPWTGRVSLDNAANTENAFPEYYVVTVAGGNSARVNIRDSAGNDMLLAFGTNGADRVTLNAQGSGPSRTGFLTAGARDPDGTDRRDSVIFRGVELVQLDLLGGPDTVLSDDTAVLTIINLGGGDDEIVVGTVPLVPDPGNRTLEFPDGVPVADTENMTNGNSAPLFVLGEGNNDRFEVNHNRAKLFLHGGAGNDRFLLKTFLVLRENPEDQRGDHQPGDAVRRRRHQPLRLPAERAGVHQRRAGPRHDRRRRHADRRHVHRHRRPDRRRRADHDLPQHRGDRGRRRRRPGHHLGDGDRRRLLDHRHRRLGRRHDPPRRRAAAADHRSAAVRLHAAAARRRAAAGARLRDRHPLRRLIDDDRSSRASSTPSSPSWDSVRRSTQQAEARALDVAVNAAKGWLDSARSQVPYYQNPIITIGGVAMLDGFGNRRSADTFGPTERLALAAAITVEFRSTFSFFGLAFGTDRRGHRQQPARHVRGRSFGGSAEADPAPARRRRRAAVRVRRRPGVRRPADRRAPDRDRWRRVRDGRRPARRAQPAGHLGSEPHRQPCRPARGAGRRGPERQPDLRPRARRRHPGPAVQRLRQPGRHGAADRDRPRTASTSSGSSCSASNASTCAWPTGPITSRWP